VGEGEPGIARDSLLETPLGGGEVLRRLHDEVVATLAIQGVRLEVLGGLARGQA